MPPPLPLSKNDRHLKRRWFQKNGYEYVLNFPIFKFPAKCHFTSIEEDEGDMHGADVLIGHEELVVWLEADGDKQPFSATGHFPILASYDELGKELYVAQVWVNKDADGGQNKVYTYVSEGQRTVSFHDSNAKKRTVSRFEVMALLHDPCDFGMEVIPEDAKFQTGPVYWLYVEGDESETESEYMYVSDSDVDDRFVELDSDESHMNAVGEGTSGQASGQHICSRDGSTVGVENSMNIDV